MKSALCPCFCWKHGFFYPAETAPNTSQLRGLWESSHAHARAGLSPAGTWVRFILWFRLGSAKVQSQAGHAQPSCNKNKARIKLAYPESKHIRSCLSWAFTAAKLQRLQWLDGTDALEIAGTSSVNHPKIAISSLLFCPQSAGRAPADTVWPSAGATAGPRPGQETEVCKDRHGYRHGRGRTQTLLPMQQLAGTQAELTAHACNLAFCSEIWGSSAALCQCWTWAAELGLKCTAVGQSPKGSG